MTLEEHIKTFSEFLTDLADCDPFPTLLEEQQKQLEELSLQLEQYMKNMLSPQVATHVLLLILQKAGASDAGALTPLIAYFTGYNVQRVGKCISDGAVLVSSHRDDSYIDVIEDVNDMLKRLHADIRVSELDFNPLPIVKSLAKNDIISIPLSPPQIRTMICCTHVLRAVFEKAGISFASNKRNDIAGFMSCLTGYDQEKIRQRFSAKEGTQQWEKKNISEKDSEEIAQVDKLLKTLNIDISFQIQSCIPQTESNQLQ
jgi:hypothetical protein